MPEFAWSAPLPPLNVANVSPAIAAALTDVSPSENVILPSQLNLGTRIRLFAQGEYTATSATPTCVLGFYMQAVGVAIGGTGSVIIAAGSALAAGASATSAPWQIWWNGRVIALSGPADALTGQIYGQGEVKWATTVGAAAWASVTPIPLTAALRTVTESNVAGGLNTNIAQKVMVGTTWSTATGVTSLTCDEFTCELLG